MNTLLEPVYSPAQRAQVEGVIAKLKSSRRQYRRVEEHAKSLTSVSPENTIRLAVAKLLFEEDGIPTLAQQEPSSIARAITTELVGLHLPHLTRLEEGNRPKAPGPGYVGCG